MSAGQSPPTWVVRTNAAAPADVAPNGSIRTDSTAVTIATALYVRVAGAWVALSAAIIAALAGDVTGPSNNNTLVQMTGAAGVVNILATAATLRWAEGTVAPSLIQRDMTAGVASGETLTIQSQASFTVVSNGGNIVISAGLGKGTAVGLDTDQSRSGSISIENGGVAGITITPTGTQFGGVTGPGGVPQVYLMGTGGGLLISADAGAPATTPANGSLFLSTSGTANTTLYIRAAGAWSALVSTSATMGGDVTGTIASNTAVTLTGSGNLVTVPATTNIRFAAALVAAIGRLRFLNNETAAAARNAADSGDLALLATDGSNVLTVGNTTGITRIQSATGAALATAGTDRVTLSTAAITLALPLVLQGVTPSATGDIRAVNNTTILAARNAANSADCQIVAIDGSNTIQIGNTGQSALRMASSGTWLASVAGSDYLSLSATTFLLLVANQQIYEAVSSPIIVHNARTTDTVTTTFTIRAQSASATATGANENAAFLHMQGGARDGVGNYGGVRLQLNADTAQNMVEVTHLANARRIVSLVRPVALSTTEMPVNTGDLVIFVGNAATVPTAPPVSGGIMYSEAGAGKWYGTSGTVTTFGPAEPHCPACGRDYVFEAQNQRRDEHLAICWACFTDEAEAKGLDVSRFAFHRKLRAAAA